MYRVIHAGAVQRLADGAFLQEGPLNRDWQVYQAWLAGGGRPEKAAPDPAAERAWRDASIASVNWLRDRHRDEIELGIPTALTADQFGGLLAYVQLLRDWPQSPDFPDSEHRPVAPAWIADQSQ